MSQLQGQCNPGHGFAKRGGRPVTWIGGGGLDTKYLASLGVPKLRELFQAVFGEHTASNNAAWLRRKLSESPDSVYGQGRCEQVRARDAGAAIWAGHDDEEGAGAGGGAGAAAPAYAPAPDSGAGGAPQLAAMRSLPADGRYGDLAAALGGGGAAGGARSHKRAPPRRSASQRSVLRGEDLPYAPIVSGGGPAACRRVVLQWEGLDAAEMGPYVEVYWPDDATWWAATVLSCDVPSRHLQLLYSNLQEEDITGDDFESLVRNGHLAASLPALPAPGDVDAEDHPAHKRARLSDRASSPLLCSAPAPSTPPPGAQAEQALYPVPQQPPQPQQLIPGLDMHMPPQRPPASSPERQPRWGDPLPSAPAQPPSQPPPLMPHAATTAAAAPSAHVLAGGAPFGSSARSSSSGGGSAETHLSLPVRAHGWEAFQQLGFAHGAPGAPSGACCPPPFAVPQAQLPPGMWWGPAAPAPAAAVAAAAAAAAAAAGFMPASFLWGEAAAAAAACTVAGGFPSLLRGAAAFRMPAPARPAVSTASDHEGSAASAMMALAAPAAPAAPAVAAEPAPAPVAEAEAEAPGAWAPGGGGGGGLRGGGEDEDDEEDDENPDEDDLDGMIGDDMPPGAMLDASTLDDGMRSLIEDVRLEGAAMEAAAAAAVAAGGVGAGAGDGKEAGAAAAARGGAGGGAGDEEGYGDEEGGLSSFLAGF